MMYDHANPHHPSQVNRNKMKLYKAEPIYFRIDVVITTRKTEHFVWITKKGVEIRQSVKGYYDSYESARQHIIDYHQSNFDSAEKSLVRALESINKAKLIEPCES